jgi:hypothetical protein
MKILIEDANSYFYEMNLNWKGDCGQSNKNFIK